MPAILVARTDAYSATLITSNVDKADHPFIISDERTAEGFFHIKPGIEIAIGRGLSFAPYADLLWFETSAPDLNDAKMFAEAVHKQFPGKLLAYNCSPSFNWKKKLDAGTIAKFQIELGKMGYKYQFVTLAGFHALNLSMFKLAKGGKRDERLPELQQEEFAEKRTGTRRRSIRHLSGRVF